MVNYNNSVIYLIRSHQTELVYVGSSTMQLSKRLANHKNTYKHWLNTHKGSYTRSYDILKYNDAYIELLEEYPCENKQQLLRREGEHIRNLNCVNKIISGRTNKEYYQDNKECIKEKVKEYYEKNKEICLKRVKEYATTNKDKKKNYMKEYLRRNKDKLREYNLRKVKCVCGSIHSHAGTARHSRSIKHKKFLESIS
jgi:hypothetical protein